MRTELLSGNQKDIGKIDILLLDYKRPSIKGDLNEVSKIGSNVRFGSPSIGVFRVVATIGDYVQGALDWVVSAETTDKVEIVKFHMVNGSLSIVGKDVYHGVTLKELKVVYQDNSKIPLRIMMSFVSKNFQLANVQFTQDTKPGAAVKGTVLHDQRKAN